MKEFQKHSSGKTVIFRVCLRKRKIEKLLADVVTDDLIRANSRRYAPDNPMSGYFPEWEEAYAFLIQHLEADVAMASKMLDNAKQRLEAAKKLKKR